MSTRLVLVGGFLGAGKSTLLARAVAHLQDQKISAGVVTNDQAAHLVDTLQLGRSGAPVAEVAGGCFCCRFDDMLRSIDDVIERGGVEVVFGEPVGSCTDLSATVLQPLKRHYGGRFELAPFSVLVDARQVLALARLAAAAEGDSPAATTAAEALATTAAAATRFPDAVNYIYRKQIEEADLLVVNKIDRLADDELKQVLTALAAAFPEKTCLPLSALHDEGVDRWLRHVLNRRRGGGTLVEVDYDRYAAGEAALGWLNALVELRADAPMNVSECLRTLLAALRDELVARGGEIAHVKAIASGDATQAAANLTENAAAPQLAGDLDWTAAEVAVVLNARVRIDPDALRAAVLACLARELPSGAKATVGDLQSFAPARPTPTHRFGEVVA